MNIALWVVSILLAAVFMTTGIMKTVRYEQNREKLQSIKDLPRGVVFAIGVCEILGALGLILPAATGILPWLTPLAAIGLFLVSLFATGFHAARHETSGIGLTVVLMLLTGFVAFGWLALMPVA
jgi:uncharacterized membrane protein